MACSRHCRHSHGIDTYQGACMHGEGIATRARRALLYSSRLPGSRSSTDAILRSEENAYSSSRSSCRA